jgi:hypothetical protein
VPDTQLLVSDETSIVFTPFVQLLEILKISYSYSPPLTNISFAPGKKCLFVESVTTIEVSLVLAGEESVVMSTHNGTAIVSVYLLNILFIILSNLVSLFKIYPAVKPIIGVEYNPLLFSPLFKALLIAVLKTWDKTKPLFANWGYGKVINFFSFCLISKFLK